MQLLRSHPRMLACVTHENKRFSGNDITDKQFACSHHPALMCVNRSTKKTLLNASYCTYSMGCINWVHTMRILHEKSISPCHPARDNRTSNARNHIQSYYMQITGAQNRGQSQQFNGCHTRLSVSPQLVAAIPACEYRLLIEPIANGRSIRRLHKLFLIIEHVHECVCSRCQSHPSA